MQCRVEGDRTVALVGGTTLSRVPKAQKQLAKAISTRKKVDDAMGTSGSEARTRTVRVKRESKQKEKAGRELEARPPWRF